MIMLVGNENELFLDIYLTIGVWFVPRNRHYSSFFVLIVGYFYSAHNVPTAAVLWFSLYKYI